jgi:regulator of protease activity HflC (stomatin/prohibitin superfamily)
MNDRYDNIRTFSMAQGAGTIRLVVAAVAVLIVLMNSFETIGAGERGVVFNKFGGVEPVVLGEGLRFKIPFVQDIIPMDVKIQKSETRADASSRDLQMVSSTIALNYHVSPDAANQIYQDVGLGYKQRIIDPAVQESVKAATANFTAEELITRRPEVSSQIKNDLATKLIGRNIVVDEFSITELTFSDIFIQSIEAKQVAEQAAQKAENDLMRIKVEAEQTITAARAEAESQRLQSITITANILQLRAIEKWNGILPQVTSGATPFIDLKRMGGGG